MKTAIIYSEELKNYDFGAGHAFGSDRFENFLKLFKEKLGNNKKFELIKNNELATDEELELWHTKDYIRVLGAASKGLVLANLSRFISQDNRDFRTGNFPKGVEKAARAAVKNSILAVDFVQQQRYEKAVGIGGGLHHAMPSYGEGFCVYNDVVIAVKHAIKKYSLERVLILDTDAHAGNGTSKAFYSDRKVLFIDLHQKGIYPGTGFINEIGEKEGKGFTVNLPLETGTSDRAYELIFDELILPLTKEYRPQMILRYGGSDPYFSDELTSLGLTLDGFKMIGKKVKEMSKLCNNEVVDLICSGYNPDILPKVWLTLIASESGVEIEFEELVPDIKNQGFSQTKNLIKKLKENLKPYWKSI